MSPRVEPSTADTAVVAYADRGDGESVFGGHADPSRDSRARRDGIGVGPTIRQGLARRVGGG